MLELVTNCDRFKTLKHSTTEPYAYTEHGVSMLPSVMSTQKAIVYQRDGSYDISKEPSL